MSFYLALDTATEACSVAVSVDGGIAHRYERVERGHTQRLMPMVRELLDECGRSARHLDGIVCGVGPGSFAGVRIGVGVVKGLALAADVPVAGISSLAMLAQGAGRRHKAPQVAAIIDARMDEVYVGAYQAGPDGRMVAVQRERVCAADAAPPLDPGHWFGAGSGWKRYGDALRKACAVEFQGIDAEALPSAVDAISLGIPVLRAGEGVSADVLVPAYLRDRVALTLKEQEVARG